MLNRTSLYGFAHERMWAAAGVDFDGTNDHFERLSDLTGIADGAQGIFSCWFRLDGGNGVDQRFIWSFNQTNITRTSANVINVDFRGTGQVTMSTTGTHTASGTWKHLLTSWDTNTAGARHIYVSDVADTSVATFTAGNLDYTRGEFWVGGNSGGGANRFNGCLAEVFFHTSWLDISVEANRRKFITAAGRPEYLGKLGERPLGVQPLVYMSRRLGAPVTSFNTNLGTGGALTLTGTLDASSSNP